jgi:cytochrome c-type biogenesis protein CcmE
MMKQGVFQKNESTGLMLSHLFNYTVSGWVNLHVTEFYCLLLGINTYVGAVITLIHRSKEKQMEQTTSAASHPANRMKFIIGGLLIGAAVIYLIISSTQASAQYFLTVDELIAKGSSIQDRDVRISGAVIGETVKYDPQTLNLTFTIADIPGDNKEIEAQGGLSAVLHAAVTDPNRQRIAVIYNGPKPDLLRDEAQAIITGEMQGDGLFHATELLLKCPTKYEEAVPKQVGQ